MGCIKCNRVRPSWKNLCQKGLVIPLKKIFFQTDALPLTTDVYHPYLEAVEEGFGGDVDYAMLTKIYKTEDVEQKKELVSGDLDPDIRLHIPGRATKPHPAHVVAALHAQDQRLLQEADQPRLSRGPPLPALQLYPHSPELAHDASRWPSTPARPRPAVRYDRRGAAQAQQTEEVQEAR